MAAHQLLDPDAERLLEGFRRRREGRLDTRQRTGETVAALSFVAAATALLVLVPWQRSFSVGLALTLIAAYAVASWVSFEVGPSKTDATQLVLVPMLFLLPAACVPIAVAGGNLLGGLPQARGKGRPEQALVALGNSWYAIGPALVFGLAGAGGASLGEWPLYLAALGAQVALDAAVNTPRDWFEDNARPRAQLAGAVWTYGVDATLSAVGLLAALGASQSSFAFLLAMPLLALVAVFAREREQRLDGAIRLSEAYRATTRVLADVVELDDGYTGAHSRTVVSLSMEVASALGLDAAQQRNVEFGALLHDVGKLGVPNEVINKPGPLSEEEWAIMRMHTVEGERILEQVGGPLADAGRVVRASHEHWDGTGYPDGLAGEQIPIEARIVACCDAFNAMTTDRSYRSALPLEVAIDELRACAGTQFDPRVARALVALVKRPAVLTAAS